MLRLSTLFGVMLAAVLASGTGLPGRAAEPGPEAPEDLPLDDIDVDALLAEVVGDAEEPGPQDPPPPPSSLRARLESSRLGPLLLRAERLPALLRGGLADAREARITPRARIAAATLGSGLLLLGLALRALRGRGDVTVCIDYPPSLRGTFSVHASRSRGSARRPGRQVADAVRNAGSSSRLHHHAVSRETHFRRLSAGRYWICVEGLLQPPDSEEIVSTHVEEQEVVVRRRRTARVAFDLDADQCPIEVKVLWDRRPAKEALIAVRGAPGSVRFARSAPARLRLRPGAHVLVVGSGDRVAEQKVEVNDLRPMEVAIDLARRDRALFAGCPPAVQPYLHGDVAAAARALERDGQSEIANLLLARLHQERNQSGSAARHFEAAGRLLEAAELREDLSQLDRAAPLFERAGEPLRAAECWRAQSNLQAAGECFARAGEHSRAAECFGESGDFGRQVSALESSGACFEAAQVAREHGEETSVIRCLQRVRPGDADYVAAAEQLTDVYERQGHLDLAARKLEEAATTCDATELPLALLDRLARLLEQTGDCDRAIEVLERLRERDLSYPNVATRIEELRKRRSEGRTAPMEPAPVVSGAPGFSDEFRYEILEELGRGGMGIVFKARDRRLGRAVALKKLPDNLRNHPKAIDLFLREARAAAALNHPNIVTLFDVGQEGDTFYITMELLEGSPLHAILKRHGRLGWRDTARLGVQIAAGLEYAHENRIVHRDIKTANLFFTKGRAVKIMDFGLAKMLEEVRRASTVIGGTPYYMAPEQALGEAVDHRADLYALGVTFFELLTGGVPFSEGDVAFHHRNTPAPDPRSRAEGIPEAFAALVLQLLEKGAEARCASAREVRERLAAILT